MGTATLWVGLDVGADLSRICAVDAELVTVLDRAVESTTAGVTEALAPFGPSDLHEIAVES